MWEAGVDIFVLFGYNSTDDKSSPSYGLQRSGINRIQSIQRGRDPVEEIIPTIPMFAQAML